MHNASKCYWFFLDILKLYLKKKNILRNILYKVNLTCLFSKAKSSWCLAKKLLPHIVAENGYLLWGNIGNTIVLKLYFFSFNVNVFSAIINHVISAHDCIYLFYPFLLTKLSWKATQARNMDIYFETLVFYVSSTLMWNMKFTSFYF